MNDDATPAKVRLTDGLGPLPEARWTWAGNGPRPYEDAYSANQMRAYAAEQVASERERCVELEAALEALVNRCNAEFVLAADEAVVAAEAALERLYRARRA